MASFIHKIWLTPVQCKVLDFIKENADAVEYKKGKTVAILPGYNEYTVNHVFIHADNKALHATLIAPENKSQDFKSTYSFSCKKPCTKKKCPLLNATQSAHHGLTTGLQKWFMPGCITTI